MLQVTSAIFPHFSHYIPADSSPAVRRRRHHRAKGYSVLLFEVDICIIRLGCVIVSGLPPSEGAPEERGRCPAQQWRAPLLSPCKPPAPAPVTHPTRGCTPAPSAARVPTCCEERKRRRGGRGDGACGGSGRAGG